MIRMIIRADDVGYCEAVNYGIAKTVKEGLVRSVGIMPNMPSAAHGIGLLEGTGVCMGQHTNVCLGKPCAEPDRIPSLLKEDCTFKSSRTYREAWAKGEDFVVLDEAVWEIEAQYRRFVELTGLQPGYFEAHAVMSENLYKGLAIVAERHHLRYSDMTPVSNVGFFGGKPVACCAMGSMKPDYDPFQCLKDAVADARKDIPNVFVCHPGYVDAYLLRSSSLTLNRTKEVEMLCARETREWLAAWEVELLSYDEY